MRAHPIALLYMYWVVLLWYGEIGAFTRAPSQCFAHLSPDAHRLLVVNDPQLTDFYSYDVPGALVPLIEFYSDHYMRKLFRRIQWEVHDVVVTGDLFDGGLHATDAQFRKELDRFRSVFHIRNPSLRLWNMTGNHDVGYPADENAHVIQRFEAAFGAPEQVLEVGAGHGPGVELVLLNSEFLDGTSGSPKRQQSRAFVEGVGAVPPRGPRVLLSHIPLFRTDYADCGPLRTGPVINNYAERMMARQRRPPRYQNYLSPGTTEYLLRTLRPDAVLSAHDHDFCFTVHPDPDPLGSGGSNPGGGKPESGGGRRGSNSDPRKRSIPEYTLGTFSWLQGNRFPSVSVLGIGPGGDAPSGAAFPVSVAAAWALHVCYLPNQLYIYLTYAASALASAALCAALGVRRALRRVHKPEPCPDADLEAGVAGEVGAARRRPGKGSSARAQGDAGAGAALQSGLALTRCAVPALREALVLVGSLLVGLLPLYALLVLIEL